MPVTQTPRVLLVADSPDEREMYAESLRRRGFCTMQAATAADALRLATELPPAAVITDLRLAGDLNGLELTRQLKNDAGTRQVPVVMLTAALFSHSRDAAARAGCDLFLPKPCLPDALTQVVSTLIGRRAWVQAR